jgi:hypothetical protein
LARTTLLRRDDDFRQMAAPGALVDELAKAQEARLI